MDQFILKHNIHTSLPVNIWQLHDFLSEWSSLRKLWVIWISCQRLKLPIKQSTNLSYEFRKRGIEKVLRGRSYDLRKHREWHFGWWCGLLTWVYVQCIEEVLQNAVHLRYKVHALLHSRHIKRPVGWRNTYVHTNERYLVFTLKKKRREKLSTVLRLKETYDALVLLWFFFNGPRTGQL